MIPTAPTILEVGLGVGKSKDWFGDRATGNPVCERGQNTYNIVDYTSV